MARQRTIIDTHERTNFGIREILLYLKYVPQVTINVHAAEHRDNGFLARVKRSVSGMKSKQRQRFTVGRTSEEHSWHG